MLELIRRVTMGRNASYVKTNFKSGDTVDVHVKVREGEKERIQVYTGTVIKVHGSGNSKTFTVRKMSNGVGVERTFPYASPMVEKVVLVASGSVRRSRLYYLRNLRGKKARIDFELVVNPEESAAPAAPAPKATETN